MPTTGFTRGVLLDRSRTSWDGTGPRPLRWAAWYPAAVGGAVAERLVGGERDTASFTFGPIAIDAPIAPARERRPLVLLSHGTGGSVEGMGWLGCRLAARGHLCIGVDHHGNTAAEPYRAEGFLCWWERATDCSRLLDRLSEIPPLADRVDRLRIAVVGFSLGGYTALALAGAISSLERFERWRAGAPNVGDGPREFPDLGRRVAELTRRSALFRDSLARHEASYADARIGAFVALAPAPTVRAFVPESVASVTRPVSIIGGEDDREAPFDVCAVWLKELNPRFELASLGHGVGHYDFLCRCTDTGRRLHPALCDESSGAARGRLHDEVAERVTLFLDDVADGRPIPA